jgi:hypothetical protein
MPNNMETYRQIQKGIRKTNRMEISNVLTHVEPVGGKGGSELCMHRGKATSACISWSSVTSFIVWIPTETI